MDFLGIVILGAMFGGGFFLHCMWTPRLRRYALASLVAPVIASVVLMIGLMIVADMNPANEYGSEYTPNGTERDPTFLEVALWLIAVVATFAISFVVCIALQRLALEAIRYLGRIRVKFALRLSKAFGEH